ncbi:MAG: signal recognition particle protein [Myxococcota bacterium]
MFETLTKGFRTAKNRLAGLTELTEENIDASLRDVRLSLLEADVEFGVTKRFLERVKDKAVGTTVKTRAITKGRSIKIGPTEQFVKICEDELRAMMESEGDSIAFAKHPTPTGIMMVGLQGAGKTTTSAKLAALLEREFDRKALLVAADMQRPGAIEQLKVLGEQISVPVFSLPDASPLQVCQSAIAHCKRIKRDTIIYDTAGRLAVDEPLMDELAEIHQKIRPHNVFLVVDAMIGQDSVKTAKVFHERLELSGVVLTKLDGDARGGAALSVKEVTGAPVKFAGTGETMEKLEVFRPEGMASRILGMGDVVGLMRDFEGVVDEAKAEEDAARMLQGQFSLEDFLEQIEMLQKMGPLSDLLEKIPLVSDSMPDGFNLDERELVKTKAMVRSMTPRERRSVELFGTHPSRVTRVARGSGRTEREVVDLLKRFGFMRQMMGNIGQQAGVLSKVPGMKQMAMANRLRDVVKTGGLETNPMMDTLANHLLEAAVAGNSPLGLGAGGSQRSGGSGKKKIDRDRQKKLKKIQRKSRRKGRK